MIAKSLLKYEFTCRIPTDQKVYAHNVNLPAADGVLWLTVKRAWQEEYDWGT
jgi:hypothetical protein